MNRPLDSTLETPRTCPKIVVHLYLPALESNGDLTVQVNLVFRRFRERPQETTILRCRLHSSADEIIQTVPAKVGKALPPG